MDEETELLITKAILLGYTFAQRKGYVECCAPDGTGWFSNIRSAAEAAMRHAGIFPELINAPQSSGD